MASTIRTRKITREKLAKLTDDHEVIKLLENLSADMADAVAPDLTTIENTATEALQSATLGMDAVRAAHGAADRLEQLLGQLQGAMLAQPDLRATVESQRRRIVELEARIETMRQPDIAGLQRQIDELKAFTLGT